MIGRILLLSCLAGVWVALTGGLVDASPTNAPANHAAHANLNCLCPFCSAIALTFSEQLDSNEVAVVAKLVELPPPPKDDEDFPKASFEVVGVLKGESLIKLGAPVRTQLVGTYPVGQKFLIMGVNAPNIAWTTPMKASDRVFEYLQDIQKLPEKGPERLTFFQDYFEDEEPVLAFDAYDEYAKAPYEDLIGMKDQMKREQLIGWIKDTDKTTVNRRRLYFTMLGVCGTDEDAELLESFIKSDSRKQRAGLDALVACYLTLKGESGVGLIEDTFLKNPKVDYVDTLAAVSALRFHGTEVEVIPQKRIVAAIRHLLDRPKMADMIIPDLARWKDWSVMERLVKMFKEADADSNWLRVPVITYLRACPKPEAKQYIEELRKIDPQAVQRADFFLGFGDDEDDDWNDTDDLDDSKEKPTESSKAVDQKIDTEGKPPGRGDPSVLNLIDPEQRVALAQGPSGPNFRPTPDQETPFPQPELDGEVDSTVHVPVSVPIDPASSTSVSTVSSHRTGFDLSGLEDTAPVQVAQSSELPGTVASVAPAYGLTTRILFIPFLASCGLLVLLWSVFNGWFERLIY